ncbi:MFS transporter [Burkholderia cenocepacia]|uniref:Major Facilitator Superfamily protein n=1 Tax=Burkholderia cenocepacia (strain ATCC BAA-245 / DSM 16553 / LMG 16656 / NCTC 13227 / J2315 / CF5610) TaxID=216591 RepID=B4E9D0_BURCJ|nr:MFS transporter [Burkholderia cenocepacia]KIS46574.1 major Facilitator Superfamily protein [Burkholderia cepacia]EPZ87113.1 transporter, major facilitator family protein [Burkholderia cenocepacia K56-2Valvano]ERI30227.1 transporter, major facilitator family protein [Burkholderia cenocepacia BC7]KKI79072.1 MFS transporter [Burkholderia cenocepacia]ONX60434.1 MFS transporter [Burkholderia cenocepacia]
MNRFTSPGWRLAAIVLVGLNLRPALAAVGPLLDMIQRATGIGDGAASLLTTIPILLMGLGALSARRLQRLTGIAGGVWLGVALIGLACASRVGAQHAWLLLASACCAGVGIAMVQALLPGFVKAHFATRIGGAMGVYSTSIMGGAVLASVIAPFAAARWGWLAALAGWALPAALAALAWPLASRGGDALAAGPASVSNARPLRSPRAWRLALFFGIATGAYTLVLAWLPPYYMRLGWSPTAAGSLLGGVTLAEVVAGLTISATIDRLPDRRPALHAAIASLFVGLLVMLAAPEALALPAALLVGAGIGALFPLSLIVTVDHAATPADAASLTGFVQGIGYLIAGLFPFAAGIVRQHLADLTPAWIAMACLCVALFVLAAGFAPKRVRQMARA